MFTRIGVALAILAAYRPAFADNVAKADELFHEALALRESDLVQSCGKFNDAYRLNPQAIGILMNVALCDEKLGRIASAVRHFSEARDRARELGLSAELAASEEKIATLSPEVPHLAISFDEPPAPNTKLLVDDRVIPLDAIADVSVDPGERTVVVTSPGRMAFETKIVLARRERKQLRVPALERSVTVGNARRTIGKITLATGGAAVATGVVLGVLAWQRYDKQFPTHCQDRASGPICDSVGYPELEKARTLGNVGTTVFIAGAAAVAVGGYLWLRAPSSSARTERTLSVLPQVSSDGGGVVAVGRF